MKTTFNFMKSSIKKQTVLIIASILFATTSFAQWGKTVKGNGNMTTVTRNTSDYDGVKCAGSFDYILVNGTEGTIKIEGEENLLEYIITEVKNNNLIIKQKRGTNLKPSSNKTIKVTIPVKDINNIALAGSGDIWNEGTLNVNDLKVSLAGSGDIVLNVNAKTMKGEIAGSGDLTLKGSTDNLKAEVAGSGDFHGFELDSKNTEVSIAGSGDAEVVSTENLVARVVGSGDVTYKGNPKKEDTKVVGSGSIKQ